ncbi:Saccharolysin [Pseudocercospora fuligena]|uniref:Saccharolysin n=1 Tax=Pseudocercospora fuligena TaxID=685502 RepID=A0A8H6RGS9_9PEZI|nr:Saccharolysin [Pseudocercospora fuligena]
MQNNRFLPQVVSRKAMVAQYSSMLSSELRPAWKRNKAVRHSSRWPVYLSVAICILLGILAGSHVAHQDSPFSLYVRDPTWHTHRVVTSRSQDKVEAPGIDEQKPPQPPRLFNVTVDSIAKLADKIISEEQLIVEGFIKKLKPEDATFENMLLPYVQHENQQDVDAATIRLLPSVGVDDKLVEACQNASAKMDETFDKINTSPEFYALVDAVYKKQKDDKKLDDESRAAIESFWQQFQGTGFKLPKGPKRARLAAIQDRLGELAGGYEVAVSEDPTTLYFKREELEGVEDDFLDGLEKGKGENDGKLVVPVAIFSNYDTITRHCQNATTRHTLETASNNMAPSNIARLKEAIAIRDEEARLLGYSTFAAMQIEGTMAKTPKAVDDLLANVRKRLAVANDQELEEMKKLKLQEEGNADKFFLWDEWYYLTKLDEEIYKVDNDFIKEYFESTNIVQKILDMYAEIYSLRYVKIAGSDAGKKSPSGKGSDLVWHPDVELFEVWNNEKDGADAKRFMGYIYVDLFNRKGKSAGSFEAPIDPGFEYKDGSRHYPTTVAVLNIKKSSSEKPTLLLRKEVQTLLHELGHVTHHITSKTKYARFHGPGDCPRDFVELPSQLMEQWSFDRKVLKRLSQHYSYLSPQNLETWKKDQNDTNAKQPLENLADDQIDNILKNKNAASGNYETRQTMYSMFDMKIHEQPSQTAAKSIDTTLTWNQMRTNITKIQGEEALGKGWHAGHHQSQFTHFMEGYEAGYYGYTWSRVDAIDVFYTAFKDDPFSSEAGGRWRHIVLEPGSSKDFAEILKEFLGRDPSDENFYKSLGLDTKTGMKKRDLVDTY